MTIKARSAWAIQVPGELDRFIASHDILRAAVRFGSGDAGIGLFSPAPLSGYHPGYDRGEQVGENAWNLAPADGTIAIRDILYIAAQFGHSC